jgi:hypothetical protein
VRDKKGEIGSRRPICRQCLSLLQDFLHRRILQVGRIAIFAKQPLHDNPHTGTSRLPMHPVHRDNALDARHQLVCDDPQRGLENPPLLVVCDLNRFRIRTNWTNSVSEVHEFALDDLRDATVRQKLKWVLSEPDRLKPGKTRQALTEQAAAEFAKLAQRLRERGHPSETVAHFINRLVFCMFAEDVDLLPSRMFKRMLEHTFTQPDDFQSLASDLFRAMTVGGRIWLTAPTNPNGRPNSDVLKLSWIAIDVVRSLRDVWIVDFGLSLNIADVAPLRSTFFSNRPGRSPSPRKEQT